MSLICPLWVTVDTQRGRHLMSVVLNGSWQVKQMFFIYLIYQELIYHYIYGAL